MAQAQPERIEEEIEQKETMNNINNGSSSSIIMAQAQPERIEEEIEQKETMNNINNGNRSSNSGFRFNVQVPKFVPRLHTQVPISGNYHPCFHYLGGAATGGGVVSDWFFVGDQEPLYVISNRNVAMPNNCSKNV